MELTNNIDVLVLVSLVILAVSLLLLLIFLIPILLYTARLLQKVFIILHDFEKEIYPNIKQVSNTVGEANKIADTGKKYGKQFVSILTKATNSIKAGLDSYNKKK